MGSCALQISEQEVRAIGTYLKNSLNPLKARFRALFTLRNINSPLAVELIGNCFSPDESSDLLKHELAYCLGQMGRSEAIQILENVLGTMSNHAMVRHEAGEALGAIGGSQCLQILKKFKDDPVPEVRETIELAINRIEQQEKSNGIIIKNQDFTSIDPALPFEDTLEIAELEKILLDTTNGSNLTQRYKSMFSLRNLNNPEATLALCKGFRCEDSALFRHEIAFVLGQLQQPVSIPALTEVLSDNNENHMVRHEAAEALGSIGTPQCLEILRPFLEDEAQIVRESCEVALDICEYEMNPSEFQYANTLSEINNK